MVITGDNKLTAEAICRQISVFGPDESLEGKSMSARTFVELSAGERRKVLEVRTPHTAVACLSCCCPWPERAGPIAT